MQAEYKVISFCLEKGIDKFPTELVLPAQERKKNRKQEQINKQQFKWSISYLALEILLNILHCTEDKQL